jgi:phosphatidyl-myo-inositol dimannoside synthase
VLALFSFDYAPLDGGIARLCTQLHGQFRREGCAAYVLTGPAPVPPLADVVRLSGRRPLIDARALLELRARRDAGVLCGRWYPEGMLAMLAGRRFGVLAHGAELLPAPRLRRNLGWAALRRRVLEGARVVLANSAYTRGLVLQLAPQANVKALPLGVDPDFFCPGDVAAARRSLGINAPVVVSTVSRVQPFKGHATVLRAISQLAAPLREQLSYVVVGRGPHAAVLSKLAHELGVASRLLMTGLIPDEAVREVYRASDLFCLLTLETPTAVEGFGLALLEAQSCGVPALGTRTGGIPDALAEGETGWLVGPGEASAVADYLTRLVRDPSEFRRIGVAARARVVAQCSWQGYAAQVLDELRAASLV